MSFHWKPYVPVAKRRGQAMKKIAALKKKGVDIQPVEIQGRKISKTFWGNAWCDHIEKFCDIDNRLPRGRTYVRNGSVCHLNITPGMVYAKVSGSEIYNIKIKIDKLANKKWKNIKKTCSGKIGSVLELLQGTLSSSVMEIVTEPDNGLMPQLGEMKFDCDCPDWADMCKHVASVLYGVGARLDAKPELLFELREVDHAELVDTLEFPQADTSTQLEDDLSSLFGVDLDTESISSPEKKKRKKPKPVVSKSNKQPARKKSTKVLKQKNSKPKEQNKPFKPTKTAIKQLRKRFEMNKSQFAQLISVSPTTVTAWEDKPGRVNLKPSSEKSLLKVSDYTKDQAWKKIK